MLNELILVHIRQLFEWVLPACLRFVRKSVKEIQPSLDTNLAQACMRLFSSLLDEFRPSGAEEAPTPPKGKLMTHDHFCCHACGPCHDLHVISCLQAKK